MPDPEKGLPRRDIVLLPLLSLLTCVALFVLAEAGARVGWPEKEEDSCAVPDSTLGYRFRPNCQSRSKAMEGPWVTNRYNSCGYRTDQECGPRPDGAIRVDLMGSSTAEGYLIPYEDAIGATLADSLSQRCGRPVEVENMGMIGYQGDVIVAQMDEALALKPDAIVFLVTPFDFDYAEKPAAPGAGEAPPVQHVELLRRIRNYVAASRAAELAQHFMFTDSARYATLYLSYGDRADFMRPPFTPAWTRRLKDLDDQLARMEAKAEAAGVRLEMAYVPSRAQAIFLSADHRPANVDPYAFGRALGEIAAKHAVGFFDTSALFAHTPDAGSLFYPHNGHVTAPGQTMVGHALASRMVEDSRALHGCNRADHTETMLDAPATKVSR